MLIHFIANFASNFQTKITKMERKGRIIKIYDAKCGVSRTTGNSWKIQDYVIQETEGEYPKTMKFSLFEEERIKSIDLRLGEEVIVHFDIDAKEFSGMYYNEIRAYKVVRVAELGNQQASAPMQQQAPMPMQQSTPTQQQAPAPAANFD